MRMPATIVMDPSVASVELGRVRRRSARVAPDEEEIAIKTRPSTAHAWLQLVSSLHLGLFTPFLHPS